MIHTSPLSFIFIFILAYFSFFLIWLIICPPVIEFPSTSSILYVLGRCLIFLQVPPCCALFFVPYFILIAASIFLLLLVFFFPIPSSLLPHLFPCFVFVLLTISAIFSLSLSLALSVFRFNFDCLPSSLSSLSCVSWLDPKPFSDPSPTRPMALPSRQQTKVNVHYKQNNHWWSCVSLLCFVPSISCPLVTIYTDLKY